jgi:hypothetical protein
MATLESSSRSTLQATYTPIGFHPLAHRRASEDGRGLEKYAFLAALNPRRHEVQELAARVEGGDQSAASWASELKALEEAMPDVERQLPLAGARHLHRADPSSLLAIGNELVRLRHQRLEEVVIERHRLASLLSDGSAEPPFPAQTASPAPAVSRPSPAPSPLATAPRTEPTLPGLTADPLADSLRSLGSEELAREPSSTTGSRREPGIPSRAGGLAASRSTQPCTQLAWWVTPTS